MCCVCDFIEDSADKVLLHPIDDHATLAQQKFVAFETTLLWARIQKLFDSFSLFQYMNI